jgi:3-oxoacyl-[acyl-carrier protein] reductase
VHVVSPNTASEVRDDANSWDQRKPSSAFIDRFRGAPVIVSPVLMDLTSKVAVVTGAAQGLGAATAEAFAACGADLAICDRNVEGMAATAASVEALGHRCLTAELDVRDAGAVNAFATAIGAEFGGVDVLVNNAGGGFRAPLSQVNAKGVQVLVDENFTSVVHFLRACDPLMRDGGSIVNVTSVESFRAAPGFAVYASMKAAIEHLTKTLALELSPRRIRVNTIAPDGIPTPGDEENIAAVAGGPDQLAALIPLGLGTTDDFATVALFLASQLSRYVTGSTIHVDGGSFAAGGWRRDAAGAWRP